MPRDDPIIERIPRRSLKKRNITPSKNELPHIGSNVAFEENMISRFNIGIARRTRDGGNIHTTRREIQSMRESVQGKPPHKHIDLPGDRFIPSSSMSKSGKDILINPITSILNGGVSDQVDRTIKYIQMLKTNLEIIKNKNEKLSSRKRLIEHTEMIKNACKPIDIQIHEMSHDVDVVLVIGLKDYTSFCDVVLLLVQYTTEVTHANFSSSGHSIFHIRQKKVEVLGFNILGWGSRNESRPQEIEELETCLQKDGNSVTYFNELDYESSLSIWDYDFQSNACEGGGPSNA
ncbi:achaete-scute transcription factor-related protein [Tanacetum coccineum]